MASLRISRSTLAELERRHVAFLEERLASPQAREDWIRLAESATEALEAARLRDLLRPREFVAHLQRAVDRAALHDFFAPLAVRVQREAVAELRESDTMLGEVVPADARRAVEEILASPELIPDALVRELFAQQAVESAIHDTLLDGLTQFNRTVNPFFAEWGIPALVRRMPVGGSLILASMEALRSEFDRRLEPEMRRFLAPFSRHATAQMAEFFLAGKGDPRFIDLRSNLVKFLWTRSLGELVAGADDATLQRAAFAGERTAEAMLHGDEAGAELARLLERVLEREGDATVGQWLESAGASGRPDARAFAELLWPQVEAVLRSGAVLELLREITAEFYEGLARD